MPDQHTRRKEDQSYVYTAKLKANQRDKITLMAKLKAKQTDEVLQKD